MILPIIISGWIISCGLFSHLPETVPTELSPTSTNTLVFTRTRIATKTPTRKPMPTKTYIPTHTPTDTPEPTVTPTDILDWALYAQLPLDVAFVDNSDFPPYAMDYSSIFQKDPKPTPIDSAPLYRGLCTFDCLMRTWRDKDRVFRLALYQLNTEQRAISGTPTLWQDVHNINPAAEMYPADQVKSHFSDLLEGQPGWVASATVPGANECGTYSQYLATTYGPLVIYIEYSREVCLDNREDEGIPLFWMAKLQIEKFGKVLDKMVD